MRIDQTYISPWGTTTVPEHLREQLGLLNGARLRWRVSADGSLIATVERRYGALPHERRDAGDAHGTDYGHD